VDCPGSACRRLPFSAETPLRLAMLILSSDLLRETRPDSGVCTVIVILQMCGGYREIALAWLQAGHEMKGQRGGGGGDLGAYGS